MRATRERSASGRMVSVLATLVLVATVSMLASTTVAYAANPRSS